MTTKKYRLGIANIVLVSVAVQIANAQGALEDHQFDVTCTRYGAKEQEEAFKIKTPEEFLTEAIVGWSGQKLILEDDGTPAAFGAGPLEAMFDIQGMGMVIFNAYLKASLATEKNSPGSRAARP